MSSAWSDRAEWLEADGFGGFASGTVNGPRTRRYHALLLCATTPPTGRFVLVNGFDAWVETRNGTTYLTRQRYAPGVTHPESAARIAEFKPDPWPQWSFELPDGTLVLQEIAVPKGSAVTIVRWRVEGRGSAKLYVRPFLSGRDYHSLHQENPQFRFEPEKDGSRFIWRPYVGVPAIASVSNGDYVHEPAWYRAFVYEEERDRGLDCAEDLAAPGILNWDLAAGDAVWVVGTEGAPGIDPRTIETPRQWVRRTLLAERKRRSTDRLRHAADAYFVHRAAGKTLVAGYPWFTDWGRDTFIALRGLAIANDRLGDAQEILLEWSGHVSEGMLPNRFPDAGAEPEFNAVDASLWYVIAVYEFLEACKVRRRRVPSSCRDRITGAVGAILTGYGKGTRYGIRADADGLLAAGEPGVQLTWMDAKVGDWVVTPRVGKAVEVQALWINALRIGALLSAGVDPTPTLTRTFQQRFWNSAGGCLFDVVDAFHHAGADDASFRPNQILAVGGLPFPLIEGERARRIVDAVEARLWTPLGLRSLAPGDPAYRGRYEGGVRERDGAYHQGTVWPWLIGPFVEAWVRVRGGTGEVKAEARRRFLEPLLKHLDDAGLGHISEIADGDPPHTARGCPFQAWSVGEVLRLERGVLRREESCSRNAPPQPASKLHRR
jgi:predicted glycogen debranching enzyme